jgi:hypothetical protein
LVTLGVECEEELQDGEPLAQRRGRYNASKSIDKLEFDN